MKKVRNFLLIAICAATVLLSVHQLPALVNVPMQEDGTAVLEADSLLASGNFETVSREDYIFVKEMREGISPVSAEESVDADIEAVLGGLSDEAREEATVYYGHVSTVYTHPSGLQLRYEVQAVLVSTQTGMVFAQCGETGAVEVLGCDENAFEGDCLARLISDTQLRMVLTGQASCPAQEAVALGLDTGELNQVVVPGQDAYYYTSVYETHLEELL